MELDCVTDDEILTLGEPHVRLLDMNAASDVSGTVRQGGSDSAVLIVEESINSDDSNAIIFWSNMAQGFRNSNAHGNGRDFGLGRGAPPPVGPSSWGQSSWLIRGHYSLYKSAPSTHGRYSGNEYSEYTGGDFRPPSPPKAPRADSADYG